MLNLTYIPFYSVYFVAVVAILAKTCPSKEKIGWFSAIVSGSAERPALIPRSSLSCSWAGDRQSHHG